MMATDKLIVLGIGSEAMKEESDDDKFDAGDEECIGELRAKKKKPFTACVNY